MELNPDSVIGDRYVVVGPVGQGGVGRIWRVSHRLQETTHALKVLRSPAPDMRQRLLQEGRIQARLRHPNIVRVTDIVEVGPDLGLIMDLVTGPSLREHLQHATPAQDAALRLGSGILDGVACAHAAGLIHRDLKPENILLSEVAGGLQPQVTDFGLARILDERGPRQTRAGFAMGTPGYMAPEQLRDAHSVDARADVFSLGVVLYELLCGQRPFCGEGLIQLYQQMLRADFEEPDVLNPALPPALVDLLHTALRPRPEERFADATELVQHWRHALDGGALSVPPAATGGQTFSSLDLTAADAPVQPMHNVQPPDNTFIGREAELTQLRELLAGGARLVTVMGPGGVGKTRLSQQLGLAVLEEHPGGVWFCDLSESLSREAACAAVAAALDVHLGTADPAGQISNVIAALGKTLLIIDNAEQVVEGAAALLQRWLPRAPDCAFVVTSRTLLRLDSEQVFLLEPLSTTAGVALLSSRARARSRHYVVDEGNIDDVRDLVQLVDGLPLAIELAAARAGMLSPAAMIAKMGKRFRLLRGSRRGVERRQAALRYTIDWSWELLETHEQAAFAQCGVFEGRFTLEAAEAVIDLSDLDDAPWPMDALQALVDKSLVRALGDDASGEPCFGMLISLQEYAAERLAEADSDGTCRDRHCAYFAGFGSVAALEALNTRGGVRRQKGLLEQRDNLRAALRHAQARGHAERILHCAMALAFVFRRLGPAEEGRAMLEGVLRDAPLSPTGRVRLQVWADILQEMSGPLHRETIQARLAEAQACAVPTAVAHYTTALGFLSYRERQYEAAEESYRRALAICREHRKRTLEIGVLRFLGQLHQFSDRHDSAEQILKEALQMARSEGYRREEGWLVAQLGSLYGLMGRVDDEHRAYEHALEIARELGARAFEATWLAHLSSTWFMKRDLDQALSYAQRGVRLGRKTGNQSSVSMARDIEGLTRLFRGEVSRAAEIARELAAANRGQWDETHYLETLAFRLQLCGRLREARQVYGMAVACARAHALADQECLHHWGLAQLAALCGDHPAALHHITDALAVPEPGRSAEVRVSLLGARALQHQLQGQPDAALALLETAETQSLAARQQWLGQFWRGTRGQLLLQLGRLDPAEQALTGALSEARRIRSRVDEGAWWVSLGEILLRRGDLPAARVTLDACEALLETIEGPLQQVKLWCLRVHLSVRADHPEEARRYLRLAVERAASLPLLPAAKLRQRVQHAEREVAAALEPG